MVEKEIHNWSIPFLYLAAFIGKQVSHNAKSTDLTFHVVGYSFVPRNGRLVAEDCHRDIYDDVHNPQ